MPPLDVHTFTQEPPIRASPQSTKPFETLFSTWTSWINLPSNIKTLVYICDPPGLDTFPQHTSLCRPKYSELPRAQRISSRLRLCRLLAGGLRTWGAQGLRGRKANIEFYSLLFPFLLSDNITSPYPVSREKRAKIRRTSNVRDIIHYYGTQR
jgi:hypothetical protein